MKHFIVYLLLAGFGFSCASGGPSSGTCFESIPDSGANTMCTQEFRSIMVKVNGKKLDAFNTIRICTGETIKYSESDFDSNSYAILDDSYKEKMLNRKESFWFVGYINGKEVIKEKYLIMADRCHVQMIEGKPEITI